MKTRKILIATGITLAAVIAITWILQHKKKTYRTKLVAENGYETAEDILFPKRKVLRFG